MNVQKWLFAVIDNEVWPANTNEEKYALSKFLSTKDIKDIELKELPFEPETLDDYAGEKNSGIIVSNDGITPKQLGYIRILTKKLDFKSPEHAAAAYIGRIPDITKINKKQAGTLIGKLKSLQAESSK